MLFESLKRPPSIWYHDERDEIAIFAVSSDGEGAMVTGIRTTEEGDIAFEIERLASLEPRALGWQYICEYLDDYH